MREIKFRQAIILNGKFIRWHYWGLIDRTFVGVDTGLCSSVEAIKNSYQYTGLKDKNGKKIYEGDITTIIWIEGGSHKTKQLIREVKWNGNGYGNVYNDPTGYYKIQVIGNIYENPELLKDGETLKGEQ